MGAAWSVIAMKIEIWLLLLAACSSSAGNTGSDASISIDSKVTAPVDAPRALVGTPVQCVKHSRTVVAPNGAKTVADDYYAVIPNVAPNDDYWVETTIAVYPATVCQDGYTCSETGTPMPAAGTYWAHRSGRFTSDGKLVVQCGGVFTAFDAAGVATTTDYRTTVTIYR